MKEGRKQGWMASWWPFELLIGNVIGTMPIKYNTTEHGENVKQ